ncbi:MAG: hypothetical protein ACNA8K_08300, partial [Cyclonatronaceae bacterium]
MGPLLTAQGFESSLTFNENYPTLSNSLFQTETELDNFESGRFFFADSESGWYAENTGATSESIISQSFTWTGNAGDNNWHTAGNWDPVGVPGAFDQVTISSGTAEVNDLDVTVEALTLSGGLVIINRKFVTTGALTLSSGTIDGPGDLVIGGLFTWAIGTIGGSG